MPFVSYCFPSMKTLLKVVVVLAVLAVAAGAAYYYGMAYWKASTKPAYRQAKVLRGEIVLVVNSTGTVQPVQRVTVGAVVSGPVKQLFVDHNAQVKKGDLLAKIDPRIYEANVARDKASLATAKAEVERAEALLQQAVNDEKRAEALRKENREYISDTELDKYKFTRMSLEAQLQVVKAAVEQAQGNLENSQTNLSYTEIRSPVDGVVIDRKIDEGQTLAAQFQAPELFVVAPEMEKRMLVYAAVDEADIGLIREAQTRNQQVQFTVDAYPEDLFQGKIYQVRLNPTTTQNVVTYTVVVEASNPQLKLLPGMTANLSFQIEKREKILKVPNAALRFYPKPEQVRKEDKKLVDGTAEEKADEEGATVQLSAKERAEANRKHNRRHVWVLEGDLLRAVEIETGLSDNNYTQVVSGPLKVGQEVVTGVKTSSP